MGKTRKYEERALLFSSFPFDAAEHRSRGRNSPEDARWERALACGTRMCRRASASAAKTVSRPGSFSLVTFFGRAKKVTRPKGRNLSLHHLRIRSIMFRPRYT